MTTTSDARALRWRRALYAMLEPSMRAHGLSRLNLAICAAILLSVAIAILETEPAIVGGRLALFQRVELVFSSLFAVEYLARLWIAAENTARGGGWRARLRWAISPSALIDLAALAPLLISSEGAPALVLRLIRLLRILRLAKLGRMSHALDFVVRAISSRRYELAATVAIGGVLLILASALLYVVEGEAQPEAFGSIPRALWWGVVTLTTIGYGDVYPITPLGRFLAGLTAISGIGLIAAPTGILAGGFAEAVREGHTPHPPPPPVEGDDGDRI